MSDALHIAIAQTAPVLRAVETNAARIAALAAHAAADALLTPELSVTGYDTGDSVHTLAHPVTAGERLAVAALAHVKSTLVLGTIEAAPRGPFNCGVVLRDGRVHFRHRKIYLPTYGMFDEGRWFGRGSSLDVFELVPGWRTGLLICEDFWHPALVYVLAQRGIELLLVQAAAPGRGVWSGGEQGAFASADVWERMARTTAQLYGIYVAYANRVGVEGAVTFAGGSLIAAPDGSVLARAGDHEEEVITAELSRAAVQRARSPYAHARDDDPLLTLRELERALEER